MAEGWSVVAPELERVRSEVQAAWMVGAALPPRARGHGAVPDGVRLRQRGAGPHPARPLQLPLPGAGRGQHGDPLGVRDGRSEASLARAARRGPDPQLLLDDRARACRARTRRGWPPVPGMEGTAGSSTDASGSPPPPRGGLRHRHGGDRPGAVQRLRPGQPVHRPHGHPRRPAGPEHLGHGRGRRRLGVARGDLLRGRPGAGGQPPRRAGRGVRHRPGPARPGAHPPLHAVDRHLPAGLRSALRTGRSPASCPPDGRWDSRAPSSSGSPRAGRRSTPRASSSCTPPGGSTGTAPTPPATTSR